MRQVRELGGFPVPDMIVQMYKKFGAALTASNIDGVNVGRSGRPVPLCEGSFCAAVSS